MADELTWQLVLHLIDECVQVVPTDIWQPPGFSRWAHILKALQLLVICSTRKVTVNPSRPTRKASFALENELCLSRLAERTSGFNALHFEQF